MNTSFLQSPEWGQFQQQVGVKSQLLAVSGTQIQALIYPTPLGNFWYIPHADLSFEGYQELVHLAKKQKNIIFIRVEPQKPLTAMPAGAHVVKNRQPEHTVILNLNRDLPDILAAMHQKTRYSIRAAQEKKLSVDFGKNKQIFHDLMRETAKRDNFIPHPPEYYNHLIDCPLVEQITVSLANQPLATALFIGYKQTYTYLHSASSSLHREAMASYWLQWQAIGHAKEHGYSMYDFWGVAPENDEKHSLAGVTRFKIRFGGERYQFGHAFELPVKRWRYYVFIFLKKLRL